ncbi:hypothetical protein AAES_05828 [Amazona aestiva]|uniref:Uncharacterized protein n=1 Tax=Amazona aestiva TaxID=12930 RepID=A0A0Q3U3U1_AMAAE|nr:hypothetical protein AAES_05828 [Amazona aestiva]
MPIAELEHMPAEAGVMSEEDQLQIWSLRAAWKKCIESKPTDFPKIQSCWHHALLEALLVGQETCMGDRRHAGSKLGQEGDDLLPEQPAGHILQPHLAPFSLT